jgi:hypothetical protein
LKKETQFEVVPLSEVLAKGRPLEDVEPTTETVEAPPEPEKPLEKTHRRLPKN